MAEGFGVHLVGDKELTAKFNRLDSAIQRKIASTAMRNSAKRTKDRLIDQYLNGGSVNSRTGHLRSVFQKAPIKSGKHPRGMVRLGVPWPTRAELGIEPDDEHYYPFALEYGTSSQGAHPFMRPAIDNHKPEETRAIIREVGAAVEVAV